ncbi:MAG: hypothetical protein CMJ29_03765 [Phycisphaerae bacterium]|nr:hypothetical protein [Phycisphaerae bacterium]
MAAGVRPRDRFLRFVLDTSRIASRQMRKDRAPMMAAALTYRLLFSLIPLMVIAGVVLQQVVKPDRILEFTRDLINRLQLDSIKVHDQRSQLESSSGTDIPFSLGDWIMDAARQATDYNTSGLTIIGGIVLFYSAIKLFRDIESSFSIVSSRGSRRIWWRRWGMYLAVLLIGPLVLIGGVVLLQWGSQRLTELGAAHEGLVQSIELILSWLLICGLIMVGYLFIPARRLSMLATVSGAVVATILLVIAQWIFRVYVSRFVVGSALGSLGLVPLFLFWLYINWLSLLYGLQFAAVTESISRLRRRRNEGSRSEHASTQ